MKFIGILLIYAALVTSGCGDAKKESFQQILSEADTSFTKGDYASAIESYKMAIQKNSKAAEPYSGLGWCYLRTNTLGLADIAFSDGSVKEDVPADLFAGWAFSLNAKKQYSVSNDKLTAALQKEGLWSFSLDSKMDYKDIYVLKAQNYFALGNYAESLAAIKAIENGFNPDVTTDEGIALLAKKIESMRN